MPRYRLATAVSTVAIVGAFMVPATAQAAGLRWEKCPQNEDVWCADLQVPVDWATGRGSITLKLARRDATTDRKIGTIIYVPGGPGDSGRGQLLGKNWLSEAAAERFDIVSLDPRGTNESDAVKCDAGLIDDMPNLNPDTGGRLANVIEYSRAVEADCRKQPLDVMDHMSSRDVARDVEAIRAAIGEQRISLYSRSYGTLAAQMYAEMFPHRTRAVVLDSVFDHSLSGRQLLESSVRNVEDSFYAFADWCARTQSCVLHGKDVGAVFDDLYRKAERGELTEPSNPAKGITATELSWLTMRVWLYRPDWAGLADRLARLSGLLPPGAPVGFPSSKGFFPMAAFCADHRITFRSESEWRWQWARLKAMAPHLRTHMVWQIASICAGWPIPATNLQRRPDVRVPVLVLNSRHDPATSLEWAVNVSGQIPRSALLTYEGAGHGVYNRTACTEQVTDRYFVDLVLPAPGASCPSGTTAP
ncbi:alpha/beta hydrolase [Kibdelosporangium aridum]|nr:alpha/beta hydrolase [Kibdelosporangium aridum]